MGNHAQAVRDQLKSLARLPDGWAGTGTRSPHATGIRRAIDVADILEAANLEPAAPALDRAGNVLFCFDVPDERVVISIGSDTGHLNVYGVSPEHPTASLSDMIPATTDTLVGILRTFGVDTPCTTGKATS